MPRFASDVTCDDGVGGLQGTYVWSNPVRGQVPRKRAQAMYEVDGWTRAQCLVHLSIIARSPVILVKQQAILQVSRQPLAPALPPPPTFVDTAPRAPVSKPTTAVLAYLPQWTSEGPTANACSWYERQRAPPLAPSRQCSRASRREHHWAASLEQRQRVGRRDRQQASRELREALRRPLVLLLCVLHMPCAVQSHTCPLKAWGLPTSSP